MTFSGSDNAKEHAACESRRCDAIYAQTQENTKDRETLSFAPADSPTNLVFCEHLLEDGVCVGAMRFSEHGRALTANESELLDCDAEVAVAAVRPDLVSTNTRQIAELRPDVCVDMSILPLHCAYGMSNVLTASDR